MNVYYITLLYTQYILKEYNEKVPTTNILAFTETNTITECALELIINNDDSSAMFYNEDDRRCILVSQLESPVFMFIANGFIVFVDFSQCNYLLNDIPLTYALAIFTIH